jgi:hypothetical protein
MLAQLIGTLRRGGACVQVQSPGGEVLLPIWPPEYTPRAEGEQVMVIDGREQVATCPREEAYLGDGYVGITDEWVLQQIAAAHRGRMGEGRQGHGWAPLAMGERQAGLQPIQLLWQGRLVRGSDNVRGLLSGRGESLWCARHGR